jgi:hypothetical protein
MLYRSETKRTHLEHIITDVGDTNFKDSDDDNNSNNDIIDFADNDEDADLVKMLRSLSRDCEPHACTAADSRDRNLPDYHGSGVQYGIRYDIC